MAEITKSEAQWRAILSAEQYRVLREKGTEAPFSGQYESHFAPGVYVCGACGASLFGSEMKFHSHCGWPSFFDARPGSVVFTPDASYGIERVEVTCATCGSHLGHLFTGEGYDTPTDQRFCINSVSLKFLPE